MDGVPVLSPVAFFENGSERWVKMKVGNSDVDPAGGRALSSLSDD